MPTVSVITPTYNRPELLSEAIQSVLAQTFTDFEMLIVDDGSEPLARRVVAGFADPRLRCLRQPHTGRSVARNLGLQAARGDFICFLDDDDLYHADKLAQEVAFLRAHPEIDVVASGFRYLSEDGAVLNIFENWNKVPDLASADFLRSNFLMAMCSFLASRDAVMNMPSWFDPVLDRFEDFDFTRRLFLSGVNCSWLKQVLSDVRSRPFPVDYMLDTHLIYRQVLKKIFSAVELPENITSQHNALLVKHMLGNAWMAYRIRMAKPAQRFLLQALILEPRLADEQIDQVLVALFTFSQKDQLFDDPRPCVDYVLHNLPPPLKHLAERRQDIMQSMLAQTKQFAP